MNVTPPPPPPSPPPQPAPPAPLPPQENDCLLIKSEHRDMLQSICDRERCFMQVIGTIDGSGRVTLVDKNAPADAPPAVDLDLEKVGAGGMRWRQ